MIMVIMLIIMMMIKTIIKMIIVVIINYANKNKDILKSPLAILIIVYHIRVSISLVPSALTRVL